MPDRKLLTIPLKTGLSQKEAAPWLPAGAMLAATNAVKNKASTMQKRPGFAALAKATPPMSGGTGGIYTMSLGRRLTSRKGVVTAFADDGNTTALYQYEEFEAAPLVYDRVPETYIGPPVYVVGYEQTVAEMDMVVSNGYRLVVFLANITGTSQVFYQVQNSLTNEVVVAAQLVESLPPTPVAAPKLVLCGTKAVLTYTDAAQTTIYGQSYDMTAPQSNWTANTTLQAPTNGGITAYDTSNVAGDTTKFALAFCFHSAPPASGPSGVIDVSRCTVSPMGVDLTGTVTDAQYTTDGVPDLDAICVRADLTNGYAWIAYSYRFGGTSRRVRAAAQNWPTVTGANTAPFGVETAVNTLVISYLAIERVGNFTSTNDGAINNVHRLAWSPSGQFMGAASVTQFIRRQSFNHNQGLLGAAATTWNVTLASRYGLANNIGYLLGYINSNTQGSYVLFADDSWTDIDTGFSGMSLNNYPLRDVGHIGTRLASGGPTGTSGAFATHAVLPHVAANPNVPGSVMEWLTTVSQAPQISGPTVYQVDFNSTKAYASAELGENLAFACGRPGVFDGQREFELGFPYGPEQLSAAQAAGSGNIPAGSYSYVAIYEQRDFAGQLHRSMRSPALAVTVASNSSKVTVTVATMGFSGRQKANPFPVNSSTGLAVMPPQPPIAIKLYRTIAGGSTYYNVDASDVVGPNPGIGFPTGTAANLNNLQVGAVTLVDNVTDMALQTHPLLYGDGGLGINGSSVDNRCAPAFQHLIVHKNRLWGVDGSNVWYSKAFTTFEGSAFNEVMAFSVDDGSGPVIALASLDDKLIIFKSTGVYYVTGDGPADNGGQNDLTPPQKITSSVGCRDWRSVLVRSTGVHFWSQRGQYILTRDLQVVAMPTVEDAISSNPVPTSAVIHPSASRLIWTSNTDDTSSPRNGGGIVYDDVLDSWTTWQSVAGGPPIGAVGGTIANASVAGVLVPTYHWLRADGTIMREQPPNSNAMDNGFFQSSVYQTPWIKSEDILNFSRFRRLYIAFQSLDPHALNVYVSYDFSDAKILIGQFFASQIAAFASPFPTVRLMLPRHRAQAVRFTITDTSDTGTSTGLGMLLMGLTLEVATYRSARGARLPAAQGN